MPIFVVDAQIMVEAGTIEDAVAKLAERGLGYTAPFYVVDHEVVVYLTDSPKET